MSDPRARIGRRTNRSHIVNLVVIGVVMLGAAIWAVATGKDGEMIALLAGIGVASLVAAPLLHRRLLRRGQV